MFVLVGKSIMIRGCGKYVEIRGLNGNDITVYQAEVLGNRIEVKEPLARAPIILFSTTDLPDYIVVKSDDELFVIPICTLRQMKQVVKIPILP